MVLQTAEDDISLILNDTATHGIGYGARLFVEF